MMRAVAIALGTRGSDGNVCSHGDLRRGARHFHREPGQDGSGSISRDASDRSQNLSQAPAISVHTKGRPAGRPFV
jgi:hypothetical protein